MDIMDGIKIEYIKGEQFIKIRDAARLVGISPTAFEMYRYLSVNVGAGCARFKLATDEMKKKADDIEAKLVRDLRRVVKNNVSPDAKETFRVKSVRNGDELAFWFQKRPHWTNRKKRGALAL